MGQRSRGGERGINKLIFVQSCTIRCTRVRIRHSLGKTYQSVVVYAYKNLWVLLEDLAGHVPYTDPLRFGHARVYAEAELPKYASLRLAGAGLTRRVGTARTLHPFYAVIRSLLYN